VRAGLAQLRVPGRLGVAIAEVPRDETKLEAYGVLVALGLADQAPPGSLWVTSAVRDLLSGSGVVTETAGSHPVVIAEPQPVFRAVVAS